MTGHLPSRSTADTLLDFVLLATLLLCLVNTYRTQNAINDVKATQRALVVETSQRNEASLHNCQASNGSRLALRHLLVNVREITKKQAPPGPQRQAAIDFYNDQIQQIHLSDCSVYR